MVIRYGTGRLLLRAPDANAFSKLRINYDFIRRDKRVTSNWTVTEKSLIATYSNIFIRLDCLGTCLYICTFAKYARGFLREVA